MTSDSGTRSINEDSLPRLAMTVPTESAVLTSALKRGALWSAGGTIFLRLGNIVLMAVVARIVSPRDLGIFTLAVTVHALIVNLAELGVASAIARSDLDVGRIAPTVAAVSIGSSLMLAVPMAIFANDIAGALGSAEAGPAIRIMAIGVALIGPVAVPGALLQRQFRQDVVFWASAIAFVPGSATLFLLASVGSGPEAFAWSRIVGQVIMGGIMMARSGAPFWPRVQLDVLRPLLAFGLPLAGANLLSQILLNADYLFIGRMMSVGELGVYFLAFNIAMWPTAVIGSILNGLVLPGISVVRRDGGDIAAAVAHGARAVALVAFPLAAFLGAFSGPLVSTIYGPKWHAAAPVLSILAVYGALFILGLLLANIIIATGRTGVLFAVQVCALAALMPALPLGISMGGIGGAAVAHIVVIGAVTTPVYIFALRRSTGLGLRRLLQAVGRPAITALTAAVVAWLATRQIDSALLQLVIGALIGATIFGSLNRQALAALTPVKARSLLKIRLLPSRRPKKSRNPA
ncbi:oligosaccharide flippase family protein [Arthrobacter sp. MI7-26]|uniref:oligosaccharide flippase family protein n=1 Tax=Arthrobacter sp. MI7-26 TaxID=2993653 RepID=UPI0022491D25|nr:oligosaccharide flippase family protein [Arthrobacter sp. MI7-26]MCX2750271.1 oligosaccharide flippase family protein [Arthrobacter sp. MI7-26]